VLAKSPGNERSSFGCQFNPAHPAVVRMILARTSPFLTSRSTATLMQGKARFRVVLVNG